MIKFEVEFEIPQLRFAHVYCPNCNERFSAQAYGKTERGGTIWDAVDLQYANYCCPKCKNRFETRGQAIEVIEK